MMLVVLPTLLFIGMGAALAILQALRPQFRFGWLTAMAGALAAWFAVILWHAQLPLSVFVPLWSFAGSAPNLPAFSVVELSWPYALSITTAALAVRLAAPADTEFPGPTGLPISLGAVGLGLLAILASDPLTLAWCWAAADVAELVLVLRTDTDRRLKARALPMFSVRLAGIGAVLLALVTSGAKPGAVFSDISAPQSLFFPAAALLRLLAFSAPWPSSNEPMLRTGAATNIQLAASAGSIAFLSHLDPVLPGGFAMPAVLAICIGSALYAGWMWFRAPDSFVAQPLWTLGLGSLAVAATLQGNPAGATGWGVAMLLVGVAQRLSGGQTRWSKVATWLGVWLISALPFSVSSAGFTNRNAASVWSLPLLVIAQALMGSGLVLRAMRPARGNTPGPRAKWTQNVRSAAIALPLALGILLGLWGWNGAQELGLPVAAALGMALALGVAVASNRASFFDPNRGRRQQPAEMAIFQVFKLRLSGSYRALQGLSEALARVLKGEAGIMWSLLLLALFVSLITARNP